MLISSIFHVNIVSRTPADVFGSTMTDAVKATDKNKAMRLYDNSVSEDDRDRHVCVVALHSGFFGTTCPARWLERRRTRNAGIQELEAMDADHQQPPQYARGEARNDR